MQKRVMVNGLPGRMASLVARALLGKGEEFFVIPRTMTGNEVEDATVLVSGEGIDVWHPYPSADAVTTIRKSYGDFIAVDFSVPSATQANINFYCENNIPFVMGTTGVDFVVAKEAISKSQISAVIAPNMAAPIVMMQFMLEQAAKTFPGVLEGFELNIVESHQSNKKDPSGTAIKFAEYFRTLGIPYDAKDMEMIRDRDHQIEMGVPEEHTGGHAWHTYSALNKKLGVLLGWKHNVNGREVYVDGTLRAINFLHSATMANIKGHLYSMTDVLMNKI